MEEQVKSNLVKDSEVASVEKRALNFIIDNVCLIALGFAILYIMEELGEYSAEATDSVFYLVYMVYYLFFEGHLGRTPGKFITGTKVVTKEGNQPSFLNILGRTLCRFIPFDGITFLWSPSIGRHDKISTTRVINIEHHKNDNQDRDGPFVN